MWRFVQVMHDANVYVAGHPTETLPLLSEYGGVDTAAKYGVIPKPFPAREFISDLALRAP